VSQLEGRGRAPRPEVTCAAPDLTSGALVRVPDFFLYDLSRRQVTAALSAVVETLRLK